MDPQLELLLEMQDLRTQRRALESDELGAVESDLFEMEIEEAVRKIGEKLEELEEELGASTRARYRRLGGHRGERAVVPVVEGICYGCFVRVPTALSADAARNEQLDVCQNCGRFLYHVA